jgi:hypothetical protein
MPWRLCSTTWFSGFNALAGQDEGFHAPAGGDEGLNAPTGGGTMGSMFGRVAAMGDQGVVDDVVATDQMDWFRVRFIWRRIQCWKKRLRRFLCNE